MCTIGVYNMCICAQIINPPLPWSMSPWRVCHWFLPNDRCLLVVAEDWEADSAGNPFIERARFQDCIFEVAFRLLPPPRHVHEHTRAPKDTLTSPSATPSPPPPPPPPPRPAPASSLGFALNAHPLVSLLMFGQKPSTLLSMWLSC